jgi:hypothetical protein
MHREKRRRGVALTLAQETLRILAPRWGLNFKCPTFDICTYKYEVLCTFCRLCIVLCKIHFVSCPLLALQI